MSQLQYKDVETPGFSGLSNLLALSHSLFGNAGKSADESLKDWNNIRKDEILKPLYLSTLSETDPVKRMELVKQYANDISNNASVHADDISAFGTWATPQYENAYKRQTELQDRAYANQLGAVQQLTNPKDIINAQRNLDTQKLGAVNAEKAINSLKDRGLGVIAEQVGKAPTVQEKERALRRMTSLFPGLGGDSIKAGTNLTQEIDNANKVTAVQKTQEATYHTNNVEKILRTQGPSAAMAYIKSINPQFNAGLASLLEARVKADISNNTIKLNEKSKAYAKEHGLDNKDLKYSEDYVNTIQNLDPLYKQAFLAQDSITPDWNGINTTDTNIDFKSPAGLEADKALANAKSNEQRTKSLVNTDLDLRDINSVTSLANKAKTWIDVNTDSNDLSPEEKSLHVQEILNLVDPFHSYKNQSWYQPLQDISKHTQLTHWMSDPSIQSLLIGFGQQSPDQIGSLQEILATPHLTREQFANALWDKMGNPLHWEGQTEFLKKMTQQEYERYKQQFKGLGGTDKEFEELTKNGFFNRDYLQKSYKSAITAKENAEKALENVKSKKTYIGNYDLSRAYKPENTHERSIVRAISNDNISKLQTALDNIESMSSGKNIAQQTEQLIATGIGKAAAGKSDSEASRANIIKNIKFLTDKGVPDELIAITLSATDSTNNPLYSWITNRHSQFDEDKAWKILSKEYDLTDNMNSKEVYHKISSSLSSNSVLKDKITKKLDSARILNEELKNTEKAIKVALDKGNFEAANVYKNKYRDLTSQLKKFNALDL